MENLLKDCNIAINDDNLNVAGDILTRCRGDEDEASAELVKMSAGYKCLVDHIWSAGDDDDDSSQEEDLLLSLKDQTVDFDVGIQHKHSVYFVVVIYSLNKGSLIY